MARIRTRTCTCVSSCCHSEQGTLLWHVYAHVRARACRHAVIVSKEHYCGSTFNKLNDLPVKVLKARVQNQLNLNSSTNRASEI